MADTGIGTLFRRWNTTTGAWVELEEITRITGPSMSRETHDTTVLNTPGGYRTFLTGLRSGGTLTLSLNYTRAAYEQMKDDFEDDDAQNYEIILPDDEVTSLEFEAYVTECPLTITEAPITFDVTLLITGAVDLESGSGPSAGA